MSLCCLFVSFCIQLCFVGDVVAVVFIIFKQSLKLIFQWFVCCKRANKKHPKFCKVMQLTFKNDKRYLRLNSELWVRDALYTFNNSKSLKQSVFCPRFTLSILNAFVNFFTSFFNVQLIEAI